MSDEAFVDPETTREEWAGVRMTDPEEEEWDVDVVVVGGTVEYVDLRVRPELLADFVDCIADDLDDEGVEGLLSTLAARNGVDLAGVSASEETEDSEASEESTDGGPSENERADGASPAG